MKTTQIFVNSPQGGIDRTIPAEPTTAQELENWKYDPQTHAWHNRFGYEPYFQDDEHNGPFKLSTGLHAPVDSIYAFNRHTGKQQFILFECNGRLAYLNPSKSTKYTLLADDRTPPTPGSPPTSYEPYGRYCIITNGIDAPVKFRGNDVLYPLGWTTAPAAPNVRDCPQVEAAGDRRSFEASDDFVGSGDNIYKGTDSTFEGISSETKDETFKYFYKLTYINENGSESPLSPPSNRFTYTSSEITRDGNTGVPKVCPIVDITTGPVGTVARKLYRTKYNGDQSLYYLVDTIKNNASLTYVDSKADISLGPEAPSILDSIPFPAPSCRFSAAFKSCLFVDGGESQPTRLYYSKPLEPDTFPALSYFEVGTRDGGDIVGLEPYYNSLLVFRQAGIDLVRSNAVGVFELVPFITGIGTFNNSTIVSIPKIGVAFLSQDGVYLITGGLDGGADLKINKISDGLDELFERLSLDTMTSAVGAYSQKERELQFWVPLSGRPKLFKGIVFHTNNAQWSERSYIGLSCITTDKDGNFLFGVDDWTNILMNNMPIKRGIYAQSGIHRQGVNYSSGDPNIVEGTAPESKFRSQWNDFGIGQVKKFPKYLYIYAITGGNQEIQVKTYKDRTWETGYDCGTAKWQVADGPDQPTYDLNKWDAVYWQDKRLVQIRYPITGGAYSDFAFEMVTNEPMTFIGYSVEYSIDGTKVIGGKRGV